MKKYWLMVAFGLFLPLQSALAVCPVCTVAVFAGLGLSRWLGIDDTISGIWIGGLTVSLIIWTINWLKKKNWGAWWWQLITIAIYAALVIYPLYRYDIVGHPLNKFWGIDKLLLGTIIGAIVFLGATNLYNFLKKKNNNHAHFPFEKVAMPVGFLTLFSLLFYFLTR